MRTGEKLLIASLLFLALFTSGCISLEINEQIMTDGSSRIEVVYDFSRIIELSRSMGEGSGEGFEINTSGFVQNITNSCDEVRQSGRLIGITCEVTDDYRMIINGVVPSELAKVEITQSFPFTHYRYNVKNIYGTMSGFGESQDQELSDESLEEAKVMSSMMMGIEMKYSVTMPGQITHADLGEVSGNKVEIDLMDLAGKDAVYIESQDMDYSSMLPIGAIAAILIVALFAILRRRAGSTAG